MVCQEGSFLAVPPQIDAISTIGAGDSSIAGFLVAAMNRKTSKEMLAMAVSYGSAACLQKGTRPPKSENIARLLSQVTVQRI